MSASRFIAGRLKVRERTVMASIAVSFLIIIIAVSVSSGFRKEIRDALSQTAGDVLLSSVGGGLLDETKPISSQPSFRNSIEQTEGVKGIHPAVFRAGIVKSDNTVQGILIKGTERHEESGSLTVSIPSRLADITGLGEGDRMIVYFIAERLKARNFTITDVYPSLLETGEELLVYADIKDLQRLNGWKDDQVSALEIELEDKWKSGDMLTSKTEEIGWTILKQIQDEDDTLYATSLEKRYPRLFQWLDLIDVNVLVILILMSIVAGFNMISGLLIILFRNTATIGTLKSMGMDNRSIAGVFLRVSSIMVAKAMLIGNALAFLFCFVQGRWHIIKLNPSDYFVPYVPVNLNPGAVLGADLAAFAMIMVLLLLPCLYISSIDPAKTVTAQ